MYFVIDKASNGQYFWKLVAENRETLCHSETYYGYFSCKKTIDRIKEEGIGKDTQVIDMTSSQS